MAKKIFGKKRKPGDVPLSERQTVIVKWLVHKRLRFGHRQSVQVYDGQLAKRLIDIMDNEPNHPVAKALRGTS